MAKVMLWLIVMTVLVSSAIVYIFGGDVGSDARLVAISCLGVLAICESIEKLK